MLQSLTKYFIINENISKRVGISAMRKTWKALLVSLLVSATFVTSVSATPSVNELKNDKAAAEQEKERLEEELDAIVSKISSLEEKLVDTGAAILEATEDLEEAEQREKEQYEAVKRCIVAMYENGNGAMLESVFQSGSIADLLKRAETVQAIHSYEKEQLESYIETKKQIAGLKESLEADMAALEESQAEYTKEKKNLDVMIAEKASEVSDLESKIQTAIEEEEARRQEAIQNTYQGGSSNSSSNSNSDVSGGYVPPSGTGGGQAIVNEAYKYLGVPYVWGGQSASGVDCSGLVLLAHRAIGVSLAHYSGSQGSGGKRISSMAEALPGDVVCYVGHVGIYLGGGKMIHAPQTGDVVRVVNVYGSPWFRRYW